MGAPATAAQKLLQQTLVRGGIKPQTLSLWAKAVHDALSLRPSRKACVWCSGKKSKNLVIENSKASGQNENRKQLIPGDIVTNKIIRYANTFERQLSRAYLGSNDCRDAAEESKFRPPKCALEAMNELSGGTIARSENYETKPISTLLSIM